MLSRRTFFVAASVACAAAVALPASIVHAAPKAAAGSPAAIVDGIYKRAAKDNNGGDFHEKKSRAKYMSASLIALWNKAEAKIPLEDGGPIGFDPVSNSQDPDIKSVAVVVETESGDKATIAATITGQRGAREKQTDSVVRYDFVRLNNEWRIDDIRSTADGEPWSIRAILEDALKTTR